MRRWIAHALRVIARGALCSGITQGCSLGLNDIPPAEAGTPAADGLAVEAPGDETTDAGDGAFVGDTTMVTVPDALAASDSSLDAFDAASPKDASTMDAHDAARLPVESGADSGDAGTTVIGTSCSRDIDCPQMFGQCQASVCRAGVCSVATPYTFLASQFSVTGTPVVFDGTGVHAPKAIAAAYPYLFLATSTGLSALDVGSPLAVSPRPVPMANLASFPPVKAMLSSGSSVYFVTAVTGMATGASQALAWVDVPADVAGTASAPSFQAHTAPRLALTPTLAETPTTIDSLYNVLPNDKAGLFLVYYSADHSTYYPTVSTAKPGATDTLIPFWNQALVTGADVAVASGSRVVAYTYDSQQPKFAIVSGPGTSTVSVGSQVTVPTPSAKQAAFASNDNGAVVWTSATLGGGALATARVTVLLPDGASSLASISSVATTSYADIEHYAAPPTTTNVVAPPVWVQGTSLVVGLAADQMDLTRTSAHVMSVKGAALTAETGFVSLPAAASTLSVASSNGFVYVLSGGATSSTVYVLAPQCAK